jgi:hypothetical protein
MTYPLAMGHRARGKEKPVVVRPVADDSRLWPAGNIYSSASDLARFAIPRSATSLARRRAVFVPAAESTAT